MNSKVFIISLFLFLGFLISASYAQNFEPRFLSSIPTGGNFAIASYGYSSGNILLDNSLPIEDLKAKLNTAVFGLSVYVVR